MAAVDLRDKWSPIVPLVAGVIQVGAFVFFLAEIYEVGFTEFAGKIVFSNDYMLVEFLVVACTTLSVVWIACFPCWALGQKLAWSLAAILFPVPTQPALGIYFVVKGESRKETNGQRERTKEPKQEPKGQP